MDNISEALDLELLPASYPAQAYSFGHYMSTLGISKAQAKRIVEKVKAERIFKSSTHQVAQTAFDAPVLGAGVWLSIKRLDREPIVDRAVLGRIMRKLLPGHVGFELLPAPERLWDSANQYHVHAFEQTKLREVLACARPGPRAPETVHLEGLPLQAPALLKIREHNDWRQLYQSKERGFPGQEAAVVFAPTEGEGPDGCVLVLPWLDAARTVKAWFPFGLRHRVVADSDSHIGLALGSSQRPLDQGYEP